MDAAKGAGGGRLAARHRRLHPAELGDRFGLCSSLYLCKGRERDNLVSASQKVLKMLRAPGSWEH